jgi:hypothetical protein
MDELEGITNTSIEENSEKCPVVFNKTKTGKIIK